MSRVRRGVLPVILLLTLPWAAHAQVGATLNGLVKDAQGAVMPGVTVEAASPVLIANVPVPLSTTPSRFTVAKPVSEKLTV